MSESGFVLVKIYLGSCSEKPAIEQALLLHLLNGVLRREVYMKWNGFL